MTTETQIPNTETPAAEIAEDDFSAAFAALTTDQVKPVAEAAAEPVVEAAVVEPAVTETSAAEAAAEPVVEAAVVDPAVTETPAIVEPAETEAQMRARITAEVQAAAPVVAEAAAAPTPSYTPEEQAVLAKYEADWPEIAKAEKLARRAEYQDVVAHIFAEVQRVYSPLLDYYQNRSGKDHYAEIIDLVPDYSTVRDKAVAWATAETQPAYLKAAFEKVIAEGSPADVADMVGRFKAATNYAAPAGTVVAPASGAAPVKTVAPLSEPAKKAAANLSVVKTSRSVQSEGADPNDFDAAFAEATARK